MLQMLLKITDVTDVAKIHIAEYKYDAELSQIMYIAEFAKLNIADLTDVTDVTEVTYVAESTVVTEVGAFINDREAEDVKWLQRSLHILQSYSREVGAFINDRETTVVEMLQMLRMLLMLQMLQVTGVVNYLEIVRTITSNSAHHGALHHG
jgi:hypothetical protein